MAIARRHSSGYIGGADLLLKQAGMIASVS
jgi:hypothetical protein